MEAGELITIRDNRPGQNGEMMATVRMDGSVEIGEGYDPDGTAEVFWNDLAQHSTDAVSKWAEAHGYELVKKGET